MSTQNEVTLTDDAISAVAKLLQLAILTGTDIVDNLRTLRLVQEGDKVTVSPSFVETFESNLQNMIAELETETTEQEAPASTNNVSPFTVTKE